MVLSQMINRGAFVASCVNALAEIAQKERAAITNVSVNRLIVYTKPVVFEGFGVISLVNVVDSVSNACIPEVHMGSNENELVSKLQGLRNYTTEVIQAQTEAVRDAVVIQYPMRTGESLSRHISVGTINIMEVFSAIVTECVVSLNQYFAAVNYDRNVILDGFDRPANDIIHDHDMFQFLNAEITIYLGMFRVMVDATGNPIIDYDFNIGLNLTALRSGKNDAMFNGIRL